MEQVADSCKISQEIFALNWYRIERASLHGARVLLYLRQNVHRQDQILASSLGALFAPRGIVWISPYRIGMELLMVH
jgi:hypothetical protein